ncbi:MAG: Lrp/AsnC family transcriptional regulator [Chloroflexi bacterium]|nr:Lrp/AsnC family transcriptional regulator [Chloroflexota bacterium]
MEFDDIDKNLLNIIQADFPLSREPFTVLGLRLGIASNEAIQRIERLKAKGIIRLISPVLNPRKLGYQTTLVAMKIPPKQLNEAGQIISAHPMVSHCYERGHDFNFWFTLAMPVAEDIGSKVYELGNKIKAEATLNLPAVKTFKIGTYFDLVGHNMSTPNMVSHYNRLSGTDFELSLADRAVINELQQDLPVTTKPFDSMATRLSMDVDEFLSNCQTLLQRRIMRRFSASISHNKLGFTANAMACWRVPSDTVETAGKKIATLPQISHCYQRQTGPIWPYNLFAMMHAKAKETCRAIADKICSETGLDRNALVLLFSTKEVKKTRVRYPV